MSIIYIKTERFLQIILENASTLALEDIPLILSTFKKGNGIPHRCYVIKAEITGNHIISFKGTNRGWAEVTKQGGSINFETRIEFGDIYQHVLLRFVLYKKEGDNIVPLAQSMWPLELRSTKTTNKSIKGSLGAYDARDLQTIMEEDHKTFGAQKNHQRVVKPGKRRGAEESSKRRKKGKTDDASPQSYSSDSLSSPPQSSPVATTTEPKITAEQLIESISGPNVDLPDFPLNDFSQDFVYDVLNQDE